MRPGTEGYEEGYSVLMSVYQKEKPEYLQASIESMISQTLACSDFVLVCDGPLTRKLEEVVEWAGRELGERFQCVRLAENRGLGAALNTGLRFCRCPVIARMDSDDISRPDRCSLQMAKMKSGDYDIVGGSIQEFIRKPEDTDKLRILPKTPEEIAAFAKKRTPFNHPCVMYKKDAVRDAGSYQDFPGFEDYHLWVRMLQNGCRGFNLQEVILDMRTGNGMYRRRGGRVYLVWVWRFQRYLRKQRFITRRQFLENCAVRGVIGIVPSGLREGFYQVFLRKKDRQQQRK